MKFAKFIKFFVTTAFVFSLQVEYGLAAKTQKKDKRSQMTEAQKKELRKRGREWCMSKVIKGTAQFERIEIMTDGRVRCWYRD